ncbi:MAG: Integrase core domain [Verrucomicrobiota bacterium]
MAILKEVDAGLKVPKCAATTASAICKLPRRLLFRALRSFPARRVIDGLEESMICIGRKPQHIRSANGPEFVAQRLQDWLQTAGVVTRYITLDFALRRAWVLPYPLFQHTV